MKKQNALIAGLAVGAALLVVALGWLVMRQAGCRADHVLFCANTLAPEHRSAPRSWCLDEIQYFHTDGRTGRTLCYGVSGANYSAFYQTVKKVKSVSPRDANFGDVLVLTLAPMGKFAAELSEEERQVVEFSTDGQLFRVERPDHTWAYFEYEGVGHDAYQLFTRGRK